MDTQIDTTTQSIPYAEPTPTTIPTAPYSQPKSSKLPLIFMTIIALFATAAACYLYIYPITKQVSDLTTSPSPLPSVESQLEASNLPSNITHYVLKDNTSSLDYPTGWTIVDNTKQINLDGDLKWSQDIKISNNGYILSSRNPLNWGPGFCIFPDSPEYNQEVIGPGEKYATYTEFTMNDGVYRRVKSSGGSDPKVQRWGICTKNSGGFGSVSGFGDTSYESPLIYDEKILDSMDKILMSIKVKKQ